MAGSGLRFAGGGVLKECRLQTPGGTLAALTNQGTGPRVLALHGWLDNARSFAPLAPWLESLELVCLDFPGHGHSDHRPAGTRYHFDDYPFDVFAAADALGWARFHLLGHSLGGAVSTLAMVMAPERIASAVLIEGLGPLSNSPDLAPDQARQAWNRTRTRPRRSHRDQTAAARARAANGDLGLESAALLAERGTAPSPGGGVHWTHDPRLAWPSAQRYTEPQVLALLGAIQAPVLNIGSDPASGIYPPSFLARRLAALPARQLKTTAGGHHLHMRNPAIVAPWILEHFHDHD